MLGPNRGYCWNVLPAARYAAQASTASSLAPRVLIPESTHLQLSSQLRRTSALPLRASEL